MLVLSRRPDEAIVLPTLGVTLRVVHVRGNVVRLGIEAPPEVRVLRAELGGTDPPRHRESHTLNNQLNKIGLALHVAQGQLARGRSDEAGRAVQQALDALEAIERRGAAAAPPARPRRPRALLVEDDSNERELLAGLLAMHDCDCAAVGDGIEALEYLAGHEKPDLVLLDLGLPRCDGAQLLRRLRGDSRFAGLKVFVVSGRSPAEAGVTAGPGGADAWFAKPLNPRTLCEAIRTNFTAAN